MPRGLLGALRKLLIGTGLLIIALTRTYGQYLRYQPTRTLEPAPRRSPELRPATTGWFDLQASRLLQYLHIYDRQTQLISTVHKCICVFLAIVIQVHHLHCILSLVQRGYLLIVVGCPNKGRSNRISLLALPPHHSTGYSDCPSGCTFYFTLVGFIVPNPDLTSTRHRQGFSATSSPRDVCVPSCRPTSAIHPLQQDNQKPVAAQRQTLN